MEQMYSYAPSSPSANQFEKIGLDEDAFKEKPDFTGKLRSFDAFREFMPNIISRYIISIRDKMEETLS